MSLNWDDLRFVLALRRAGSLGAAARLLKVEQSTASQRPEGQVRLASTESMATFLMAGLVPLREEHPKIHVQLVVGSAPLDLLRREADLAVRMVRDTSPTLVTRRIGVIGWSLFASPEYVDRTGVALGGDVDGCTLAGHAVIGYAAAARSPGGVWLAAHSRPEDVVLTGESVPSVLNAIKAGIGLSVLPCYAICGDASLVRLTPAVVARGEVFLSIPPEHRDTVRVRLVMDAVTALFERERTLLEGSAGAAATI